MDEHSLKNNDRGAIVPHVENLDEETLDLNVQSDTFELTASNMQTSYFLSRANKLETQGTEEISDVDLSHMKPDRTPKNKYRFEIPPRPKSRKGTQQNQGANRFLNKQRSSSGSSHDSKKH